MGTRSEVVRKESIEIEVGEALRLVQEQCAERKGKWQRKELMTGETSLRQTQTDLVSGGYLSTQAPFDRPYIYYI